VAASCENVTEPSLITGKAAAIPLITAAANINIDFI
jgi:hypothetical protein